MIVPSILFSDAGCQDKLHQLHIISKNTRMCSPTAHLFYYLHYYHHHHHQRHRRQVVAQADKVHTQPSPRI